MLKPNHYCNKIPDVINDQLAISSSSSTIYPKIIGKGLWIRSATPKQEEISKFRTLNSGSSTLKVSNAIV